MTLYNETRDQILATNVILAKSFLKRLKGLMGRRDLEENSCMLIDPCNSIHTFFMGFNIHVLFLTEDYRVIKIVEDMKPSRISPYVKEAILVVELPASKEIKGKVKIGDQLRLI